MSFFSFTNSADAQFAIRQALTSTVSLPVFDAGAPPPLPPGTRQRHQEIKAQARCRTHARSAPHSSAKRW
ncbi:hypothetical protein [Hymenobacter psychrophilus]|uniref:Uncharacterized protein n=1 Tax=Hymenobacter psychrophilus TaxID=651662 RepID=A0A1H3EGZ3_9BACT|nr:hypothetical protein [Hymenobacter psychrophilus]SDX77194.1 hypothetical protein SAMN04488069_103111 [Hymenobacter psychrophilus]